VTTTEPLDILAALVLEDGRRWGEAATPDQWADAAAVLDPAPPNLHFLTRPRGGSKTSDLAGIAVALLATALPPLSRSYAFAVDRDQAGLLVDAARGYIDRTPGLDGHLEVSASVIRNRAHGATLEVMAADDASAFGLRPHLTIVDEAAQWRSQDRTRRLWAAILSGLPKVPGSRLVVLTSAGDPSHFMHAVLEGARTSDAWRTSEWPGPVPWADPVDLAEQRRMLLDWEYARLHLNQWVSGGGVLALAEDLAACVRPSADPLAPEHGRRYVCALDLGLVKDRTVAVVAHLETAEAPWIDGRQAEAKRVVVVDRINVWQGSRSRPVQLGDVEEWLSQAHSSYRCRVVADPWQATGLGQRLKGRGVRFDEFTFSSASTARLATTLHGVIRGHGITIPNDRELVEELSTVRLVETGPSSVRIDHESGRHDDRAIAVALAAVALLSEDVQTAAPVTYYRIPGRAAAAARQAQRRREAEEQQRREMGEAAWVAGRLNGTIRGRSRGGRRGRS
jgi:phage terminase large subunit-like protein